MPVGNKTPVAIIYVPGKNPKPPEASHHQQLWACLAEGVRRVDAELATELTPDVLRIAAWNPLFYYTTREPGPERPWINALLERAGACDRDRREAGSLLTLARRWTLRLGNRFPRLARPFASGAIRDTLDEVERYFDKRGALGERIRACVRERLLQAHDEGCRIVLIGHSLGSVIAWDTLWELGRELGSPLSVDLFLTMGSPLGTSYVQRRLLGSAADGADAYPNNIRRWVNITATGDMTALDPTVADDFSPMLNGGLITSIEDYHKGVYTRYRDQDGLNVHRAYGYLLHPVTAATLALWWRQQQLPETVDHE